LIRHENKLQEALRFVKRGRLMEIVIRNAEIATDIRGIRDAHGSDEHWGSDRACYASQKTRLENGFFIQVAVCNDTIAGHAEWVLSRERGRDFLYLGLLQVRADYQKRGVGTKLLASGEAYARDHGCAFLRTMPNTETGSVVFYQKNGFVLTQDTNNTLQLKTTMDSVKTAVRIDAVPFEASDALPLAAGLYQHSSRHMWNVYNARAETDKRVVSSFRAGRSYFNIGAFAPSERASAVCWSARFAPALIAEILAVGGGLGYRYVNFCVLNETVPRFGGFAYEMMEEHDVFMEKRL